jgi:hypothetical protein
VRAACGAPGYAVAAPNASVTLNGQAKPKIELGMDTEWFQQSTNQQLTVRLVGSQVCSNGAGGFTPGVTTLAQAPDRPIGEVHVQAIFPQFNTTVKNGAVTKYPTCFTRSSVSFE